MILIKLASRSRPLKFVKALQNIKTMTQGDYKVLVSADSDDRTMNNKQMIRHVSLLKHVEMYFGDHQTKVEAINRDLDKVNDWDILVNFSDDFQIVTRGWDRILRDQVSNKWPGSTDWYAHYSDNYTHDALPTISIMGRDYFNRAGHIYHPSYKSFSCDAEQFYVAKARGCYHYFPERLFKHEHPANNRKLKNDVLYKLNSYHTPHDVKNYFERLNNDFYLDIPGPHEWDQYKTNVTV
jgi:hypothetical protein